MSSSGDGIGVLGLLGVCFVVLKLTGVITWAWIWVLAPFWGALVLVAVILLLMLIPAMVMLILALTPFALLALLGFGLFKFFGG